MQLSNGQAVVGKVVAAEVRPAERAASQPVPLVVEVADEWQVQSPVVGKLAAVAATELLAKVSPVQWVETRVVAWHQVLAGQRKLQR